MVVEDVLSGKINMLLEGTSVDNQTDEEILKRIRDGKKTR